MTHLCSLCVLTSSMRAHGWQGVRDGLPADQTASEPQFVWLGNQWVSSTLPGRPRNHDLLYFARLAFDTNGTVAQLAWQDDTVVMLPGTAQFGFG